MNLHKLKKFFQFDTAGWIATSSLLLCAISGVFLAIPYDFTHAHASISELLLYNPAGTLVRNFHYWSAQLFFIFSILHVYDHLKKSTETNIRTRRTRLILCLALVFMGYEMISGFILKGDAAGIQAQRILASLLESVPVIGKLFSSLFIGTGDNTQVLYVQHVAFGTILLFIAVFDHVRTIWPRRKTWIILFFLILIISFLFRAPLGLADNSQVKGPWFFVGIQEMLHLTSHPVIIIILVFVFLAILYFLPLFMKKIRVLIKRILFAGCILYFIMTLVALLFRGENWEWKSLSDNSVSSERLLIFDPVNLFRPLESVRLAQNQRIESCLTCHASMKGLSDSHNPAIIGCVSCHRGDPYAIGKSLAHRNMILIPGNFSNMEQTCGTQSCHPDIANRIQQSLMATQSGIIAVDKYVFGETASLNDTFQIKNIGHSAADTHLRNLCAGCHLGMEKIRTGNAEWLERGGGCNACHLHYSDEATVSLKRMQSKTMLMAGEIHPTIDIQVSNDRCLSCHSRSGRISLSYEGWNETNEGTKANSIVKSKVLPDHRLLEFVQADVHHQAGMACIDCHTSYDVMGNGKHAVHREDAVSVQCIDCHTSRKVNTISVSLLPDKESQMIAWLRKSDPKIKVALTARNNEPLMNTRVDSLNRIFLTDKLNGKIHESKPPSLVCTKGKGHERLSCEACHTSWVPQCIGCHNSYENGTPGFDLLTNKTTRSTWVEFAGQNLADPPVLGVNTTNEGKVVTAMPGMVLSIDQESFSKGKGKSFHRLYAPASGHTTQREGRSCKSCHNNPLAIGYGRGELTYQVIGKTGQWSFTPRFALNINDSLPEDAWVGFLKEAKQPNSTRTNLRPFTVAEQRRILQVGACLTCHDEKSKVMDQALMDFPHALARRSNKCILSKVPL